MIAVGDVVTFVATLQLWADALLGSEETLPKLMANSHAVILRFTKTCDGELGGLIEILTPQGVGYINANDLRYARLLVSSKSL